MDMAPTQAGRKVGKVSRIAAAQHVLLGEVHLPAVAQHRQAEEAFLAQSGSPGVLAEPLADAFVLGFLRCHDLGACRVDGGGQVIHPVASHDFGDVPYTPRADIQLNVRVGNAHHLSKAFDGKASGRHVLERPLPHQVQRRRVRHITAPHRISPRPKELFVDELISITSQLGNLRHLPVRLAGFLHATQGSKKQGLGPVQRSQRGRRLEIRVSLQKPVDPLQRLLAVYHRRGQRKGDEAVVVLDQVRDVLAHRLVVPLEPGLEVEVLRLVVRVRQELEEEVGEIGGVGEAGAGLEAFHQLEPGGERFRPGQLLDGVLDAGQPLILEGLHMGRVGPVGDVVHVAESVERRLRQVHLLRGTRYPLQHDQRVGPLQSGYGLEIAAVAALWDLG
ncbi:hypothetical protein PG988_001960 [Apiospora saccharicola]